MAQEQSFCSFSTRFSFIILAYVLAYLQLARPQSVEFGMIANPVVFKEMQPAGTTVAIVEAWSYDSNGFFAPGGVLTISPSNDAQYFRIESSVTDSGARGILTSAIVFDGKTPPQNLFSFQVTFTAANGVTTANASVYVQLQYVNQPPRFENRTYDVWVPQDTPGGAVLLTVIAVDTNPIEYIYAPDETGTYVYQYLDNSGVVTYSIVGGNSGNTFALDPQTGALSLAPQANLDVASGNEYNLTLFAIDGAGLSDTALVYVHVVAVNAHAPVIESPLSVIAVTLPEDTHPGRVILSGINATDADAGTNGQIRFFLISSGDAKFSVDAFTGKVALSGPLSWIAAPEVVFAVVARDRGIPPLESNAITVVVTVTRVYNYPPVFSQPFYVASIQENLPAGTRVLSVTAYEPIAGDFVNYSIVGGSGGSFAIDQLSGLITTNATLNWVLTPFFNLTVAAVDNYANLSLRMSAFATVYVQVTSSNDHPPQWGKSAYHLDTFSVPPRTDIGTLMATSLNQGFAAVITYSFVRLDPTRPYAFRIYPSTGLVRSNQSIAFASQEFYYYIVRAQDSSNFPQYTDVMLTIQVRTTNYFPPMFNVHNVNITLIQNVTVGMIVLNQTAIDWDTGVNGQVRYRILTPFDQTAGSFDVNHTSGQVYVNTTLNYGLKLTIPFVLQAYDGGYPTPLTDTINVTVFILHSPLIVLSDGYEIVVPENEPANFSVITLRNYTFDPDPGNGGIFQYSDIASYDSSPDLSFDIESQTGEIKTLRSFSYNEDPFIIVTVLMRDNGNPPLERHQNLTIFVIKPPEFLNNASASVYEYLPNIVVLREYRAINLGIGIGSGIITYCIANGDPQGDFKIDPLSGGINVTMGLNRTRHTSYALSIMATDHGVPPLNGTGYIFVDVLEYNKHAPVFTQNPFNIHILENATFDSVIYRLNVTDQDMGTNAQVHYFIANTTNTTRFSIRNTTGEILTNSTFNHEALSVFVFMVIAVDHGLVPGHLTGVTTVQITLDDVNDYPPIFNASSYNGSMVEHSAIGTPILFVFATDKDPTAPNNVIHYSLAANMSDLFDINPLLGVVYVANEVDWMDGPIITLTVIATDQGYPSMSGSSTMYITVLYVNYYAPVFKVLALSVFEDQPPGTPVGCVLAVDNDNPGNNSQVQYSMLGIIPNGLAFAMNSSGCVTTNMTLDRENISQYNITVVASDYGSPVMSTTGILMVSVLDVNDNSPVLNSTLYTAIISEILPINTPILQVHATDKDIGTNALVRYYILDNVTTASFMINESTGVLYVNGLLLYERQNVFQFEVLAKDSGTPPLNSTALVQISLTDYNVHPPAFVRSNYSADLRENLAPGHVILRVNSTDVDSGTNAITGYSLLPTPNSTYFAIDNVTGVLYATSFIDREKTPSFNLTIVANNTLSDHPLSSTVPISIQITDLNDNNPSFPLTVNVTIAESILPGTLVNTLAAHDGDAGLNGTVQYFIYSGNDNGVFALDPNSGNLTITSQLNFQTRPLYMFAVMACDLGMPPLCNYTNILVTVLGGNNNPPTFTSNSYTVTIFQGVTTGQVVTNVSATDVDQNSSLSYALLSAGGCPFKLSSSTSGIIVSTSSVTLSSACNLTLRVSDSLYNATAQLQILFYKTSFTFKNPNFATSVAQNTQGGTSIFNLATSTVTSAGVTYGIESGNIGGVFGITASQVTLVGQLNYLNQSLYELTITATDGSGNKVYALLRIQVNDTNKYPPLFLQNTIFIAIPETASTNVPLFSMVTTDRDGTASNRYAACSFQPASSLVFSFLPLSCNLQLNSPGLNYLAGTRTYNLTVNASNTAIPSLSSVSQLSVMVLNGNKYSPQFTTNLAAINYYISENTTVGTRITAVNATDMDIGLSGDVTYGMFGAPFNYLDFTIDTYTGLIWLSSTLSYKRQQSYVLTIVAGDGGNPGRTATGKVTIQVVEVDDSTPAWQQVYYMMSVLENATVNYQVITVIATDNNYVDNTVPLPARRAQYGYVSYSITVGNPLNQFAIDIDTGVVTIVTPLDRENIASYNLTLTATDGGGLYSNAYLYIKVLDLNDNPPVFHFTKYNATMPENAPVSTFMIQLTATDRDISLNAVITFAITGGNSYNSFRINTTTGSVYTNAQLNWLNVSIYNLIVVATDKGVPSLSSSAILTVKILDINDNAPTFMQKSYNASVYENRTISFPVLLVNATDPDYGENGTVMYSLLTRNTSLLPLPFSINASTGIITVSGLLSYKSSSNYTFTVLAQDSGNPIIRLSSLVNVTINIIAQNLNPPLFPNASYIGYVLLNAGPGVSILTVSASDSDVGVNAQIMFSLNFRGSTLASSNFVVDSMSGVVKTSNISMLGNGSTLMYNITVVATDMGTPPLSSTANLTIVVIPAPLFNQSSYSGQIYENLPSNSYVATVSATDRNPVGYLAFSLVNSKTDCITLCSNSSFCSSPGFTHVPSGLPLPLTANWSTNVLVSTVSFDRENISEYVVTVRAYDVISNGSLYNTTCLYVTILDMNDNGPIFTQQTYWANISENAPRGALVTTVLATDADTGTNAEVQYSIIFGGDNFTINSSSGQIFTQVNGFSYETKNMYNLTVLAKDKGNPSLNSTVTVTIAIWDENNHHPVFSQANYSSTIYENLPSGTYVLAVSTTDGDSGLNALVSYFINFSIPAWHFAINSSTGLITTNKSLNREYISSYSLLLVAMDHGIPPLYGTVSVMVRVLDINDNPPAFIGIPYVVNITENVLPSTPVLNLSATDADTGTNAAIFFSLVSVFPKFDAFQINLTTGALSLTAPLDAETSLFYIVTINASNGPALLYQTTLVNVTLNVLDMNDNSPYFNITSYAVNLSEHALVGAQVLQLLAKDSDATLDNSIVAYSIIGGFNVSLFFINSTSGVVYLKLPLNKRDASYNLIIQAKDNGHLPLSSNVTLFIIVLHTNDYPPNFLQALYVFYIEENEPAHTLIGQVEALDVDFQEIASYALSNITSDSEYFSINSTTGQLYSVVPFDSEMKDVYEILVLAVDNGTVSRTSEVNTTIFVLNVYDDPPEFMQDLYNTSWPENTAVGTVLLTITAIHQDLGNDSRLEYLLLPGNDSLHFAINQSDFGNISLAKALDREQQDFFNFMTMARDVGYPFLNTTANITIHVLDVNDNTPLLNEPVYNASLFENTNKIAIVTIFATDRDIGLNALVSFSLSNSFNDLFNIANVSGTAGYRSCILWLNGSLDYEAVKNYSFLILATDAGSPLLSSSSQINIYVKDNGKNEFQPVFSSRIYNVTVPENTLLQSSIIQLVATDGDTGSNGVVRYSILNGNNGDTFVIDAATGWITSFNFFNRDLVPSYSLTILAYDLGTPSFSTSTVLQVTVGDVNNHPPIFNSRVYTVALFEDVATGQVVTTLVASDGDIGSNANITYTIVTGNTTVFRVGPQSGNVTLASKLNYAVAASYDLSIMAQDGGIPPLYDVSNLRIIITQVDIYPPSFPQSLYNLTISSRAGVGARLAHMVASNTDVYSSTPITYSLIQLNRNIGNFSIDPNTGVISVASALIPGMATVIVQAKGAFKFNPANATLLISITTSAAIPTIPFYFDLKAYENATVGAIVANLGLPGPSSVSSDAPSLPFSVQLNGTLLLTGPLDAETTPAYCFNVKAILGNSAVFYGIVTVLVHDINDRAPQFESNSYVAHLSESSPVNTTVLYALAYDRDTTQANRQVTLAITGGNGFGTFALDPNSGQLTLVSELNYEAVSVYNLTVTATDSSLSSSVSVIVMVTDENLHSPVFDTTRYFTDIFASAPVGATILSVRATDADSGTNSALHYFIVPPSNVFFMNSTTGTIYSSAPLLPATYSLTLLAADGAVPTLSTSSFATVAVHPVNLYAPVFGSPSGYSLSVPESQSVGQSLLQITATDAEGEGVSYSIVTGDTAPPHFQISPLGGLITLASKLDYTSQPFYAITVQALDGGYPPKSATVAVNVTVLHVVTTPPQFNQSSYGVSVPESTPTGTVLLRVSASSLPGVSIVYSISQSALSPSTGLPLFAINETTGDLSVSSALDHETLATADIVVTALGLTYPIPLSNSIHVIVVIEDVDDNPPTFTQSVYQATAVRLLPPGQLVVTLVIVDPDWRPLVYSIAGSGGAPNQLLQIDPLSGKITTARQVAENDTDAFNVTVRVTSGTYIVNTTVTVQLVNSGSFCEGPGYCTNVTPTVCNVVRIFTPPYYTCAPYCSRSDYFLSPLKTVCIVQYCQDSTLLPCNVTNTCNASNVPCGGKCLPGMGLCLPPTNLCFPVNRTQPCDAASQACLLGQALVQVANGSRYCTSVVTSCNQMGYVYCEGTAKCANLSDPLLCSLCPIGQGYCNLTKSCIPTSELCCPIGMYSCLVLGACLANNSRCLLPNTAPNVTSPLVYLNSVTSLNASMALAATGHSIGLLLGNNNSIGIDSNGDEVGMAITDSSPSSSSSSSSSSFALSDLGEWQYALCLDVPSFDLPGGCSNITTPWTAVGLVSDTRALRLPNTARLRFVRRAPQLEGAVWLRAKLWDGNQDGYLTPASVKSAVRYALPSYVSTIPFVASGAYSNGSMLLVSLVYPVVLPPSFSPQATFKFSKIAQDTPFVNNNGNSLLDLVNSVNVLYQPVLPDSSITGWPTDQLYDLQLPPSVRGQYLSQVATVNPTRLHRNMALSSGQLPGVGVSLDPTSMVSGRWQVSWSGDERYYIYLDSLLSPSNGTTVLLNTTASLRFIPNPTSCGNASILLAPWDGYWIVGTSGSMVQRLGGAYIVINATSDPSAYMYGIGSWYQATLQVVCIPYNPVVLSKVLLLNPIPYQISYNYGNLFRALVAGTLASIDVSMLESLLGSTLISRVRVLTLAPANATHTNVLFNVSEARLNASTVASLIAANRAGLVSQSITILGLFQDFFYGPGIGCAGTTPFPYYGTVINNLISNVSSDINGDFLGAAVTSYQAPSGQGVWQYHRSDWYPQDGDPSHYTWYNFPPTLLDTRALLLRGTDRVRFIPRPGYFWSTAGAGSAVPSLVAKVWDTSKGTFSPSELSLLNVNTNPNVDTLQSLINPIGLFSASTVTILATRYGCDGSVNSGAVHNKCCVCGGSSNGTQCTGCDGHVGSGTTVDSCGICSGGDSGCLGCDYVPFSGAGGRSCGCISGGMSGTVYDFSDCHRDCYGTALVDSCGVCSGGNTGHTYNQEIDCMGACFGNATIDLCGDCTGLGTPFPLNKNLDCSGVCGGPFRADSCGVCQLPNTKGSIVEHRDCAGVCFGSAKLDSCGLCYGGTTGLPPNVLLDVCGVCKGNGSTCQGCDGVVNSGHAVDSCGTCGGNDCGCFKIASVSPNYAPQSGLTVLTIQGAGFFVNQTNYYNPRLDNCNATRYSGLDSITGNCIFTFPLALGTFKPTAYLVNQSILTCTVPAIPVQFNSTLIVTLQVSIGSVSRVSNALMFTYYQSSFTLSSSIYPSDVAIGNAVHTTIFGQGFINTSVSMCGLTLYSPQTLCSFATPLTVPAMYLSNSQVVCLLPASYQPCQVRLSLLLDGQTSGQVSSRVPLVFTYRSPAPQVTDVHFLDDLSSLLVQFDHSVLLNGTSLISSIFRSDTYATLGGPQATFQWTNRFQNGIIVYFPVTAKVMVNSPVGFNDGIVISMELYSYAITNLSVLVSPYINAVSPLAVLNGPNSIPICGPAVFSAAGSLYSGYRPFIYHWNIFVPDVSYPGYSSLVAFFNSISDNSSQISIDSLLFQTNVSYTLQLVVTSAIGLSSAPVTRALMRGNSELLSISFGGALVREYQASSPILVESSLQLLGCSNRQANFTLQWHIYNVTNIRPYTLGELTLPRVYRSSPSLFLSPGTLAENGSYVVTLHASTADGILSSELSLNLTTTVTLLRAWILGGSNRTVSWNYTLVLDGSFTTFSTLLPPPVYEWSCTSLVTLGPCFNRSTSPVLLPINLPRSNVIRIPAAVLASGEGFSFTMSVSQGSQSSTATVAVYTEAVSGLPRVEIVTQSGSAVVGSKVTLEGLVYSAQKVTDVHWECLPIPGQGYIDLSSVTQSQVYYPATTELPTSSQTLFTPLQASITASVISRANLILAPNTLMPGLTYTFALVATNQQGTSYSSITITAYPSSRFPVLLVSPPSGVAVSTTFSLTVVDPLDSTGNLPFTYQFGLFSSLYGLVWLTGAQSSGNINISLPSGMPLIVVSRITAKSGSFVNVNSSCTVIPQTSVTDALLGSQLNNITLRYGADKSWRTALANTLVLLLQQNSTAKVLSPLFKNAVLGLVSSILNGPLPQTSADYSVVASVLSLVTVLPGSYDVAAAASIATQLTNWFASQSLLSSYSVLPRQPDGTQPSVLLSNTSGALNPNASSILSLQTALALLNSMARISSSMSTTSAASTYVGGVSSIAQVLCKQIVTGENPISLSTSISQLYVHKGVPKGAFNVSDLLVNFGNSLSALYNTSACGGTAYVACDEACIQGVTYTHDLFGNSSSSFANSSSQVLQLSPIAAQKINTSIAGINTQNILAFSSIFSVTISLPNQNKYLNISGLPTPFQVYIPAVQLPLPQSTPLCFYRSLLNVSSALDNSSYLWKLDSTAPPPNTTIGGKLYYVCSFTHLTDFVIGALPAPVAIAMPTPVATSTTIALAPSSTAVTSTSRRVPTFYFTTAPRPAVTSALPNVVTPTVATIIPILFIIAVAAGIVVTVYMLWRKKHKASAKIIPVATSKEQKAEVLKSPVATIMLTPEQSKVPMDVIKLTEGGERQKVGMLNVLPSIRLRELRHQIMEELEAFKGKPFYLLTKQLCDIEPAAEQQMFVSLVYGTKFVFLREVSDKDEYAKQFCTCSKAAQFLCTGCEAQGYCSEECQGVHWAGQHQRECGALSKKRRRNEILNQHHRQVSIAGLAAGTTTPGVRATASDWKSFLKASRPPSQVAIKISPETQGLGLTQHTSQGTAAALTLSHGGVGGQGSATAVGGQGSATTMTSLIGAGMSNSSEMPQNVVPQTSVPQTAVPQTAVPQTTVAQTAVPQIAVPQVATSPQPVLLPPGNTSAHVMQQLPSPPQQGSAMGQTASPDPTLAQQNATSPDNMIANEPRPSVLSPFPQPLGRVALQKIPPLGNPLVPGAPRQYVAPLPKPPVLFARAPVPRQPLMSPVTTPGTHPPPSLTWTPLPRAAAMTPAVGVAPVRISASPFSPLPGMSAMSPSLSLQLSQPKFSPAVTPMQPGPRPVPQTPFGRTPTVSAAVSPLPPHPTGMTGLLPLPSLPRASHQQPTLFDPVTRPLRPKQPSVFSVESRMMVQSVVPDDLAMSMSLNASMFKKVRDEPLIESEGEDEESEEGNEDGDAKLKDSESTGSSDSSSDDGEEVDTSVGPPVTAPPPPLKKKRNNI